MKIIFNAYNLIIGGGLTVGQGITKALLKLNPEDEIHIFLPKRKVYNFSSSENVTIHYIPRFLTDFAVGRFFAGYYLAYKARQLNSDIVFSLGNYAIPFYRQLLLLQWPYAVYPEKRIWSRMSFQNYIKRKLRLFYFRKSLKYAASLTVQTQVMKERVEKYIPLYKGPIHVIESSFKKNTASSKDAEILKIKESHKDKLLLCMSEYYSHKNLEILIPVAELIKKQNLNYKILLTIDVGQSGASMLLKDAERKGLSQILVNLGRLDSDRISAVYSSCDALVLPTLVESYGIPYLEAANSKLPVLTSDRDFAHAINEDNAWYFDPLSATSILQTIEAAFADPDMLRQKVEKAFLKSGEVRSWEEITKDYLRIIKSL